MLLHKVMIAGAEAKEWKLEDYHELKRLRVRILQMDKIRINNRHQTADLGTNSAHILSKSDLLLTSKITTTIEDFQLATKERTDYIAYKQL